MAKTPFCTTFAQRNKRIAAGWYFIITFQMPKTFLVLHQQCLTALLVNEASQGQENLWPLYDLHWSLIVPHLDTLLLILVIPARVS